MITNEQELHNFESSAIESRSRSAVAAASRFPAKEESRRHPVTTVCRHRRCRLPVKQGISIVERLPPGPTTSKDSMNVY
jgi:hypothetical protein